jgi:ribonuclease Y
VELLAPIFIGIVCILGCLAAGYVLGRNQEQQRQRDAEHTATEIRGKAREEGEALRQKALLEAQNEILTLRQNLEGEQQERRGELRNDEKRLAVREESLDFKQSGLEQREQRFHDRESELERRLQELSASNAQTRERLEEVARMTSEKAREELFRQVEHDNQLELVKRIRQSEELAREEADRRARRIIVTAIQKLASEQVIDSTVSVVNLPNDEMKGRIIGREGRNIRMLESMTGVDLIIDDTPEAVVLSCFDPVRREIARVALEKLVADGRIHPARIEEMVEKSRKEMDERIREEGERAAFEVGITGLHADLIRLMGRLRFRSSYGQNVLFHSIEVSFLCAQMAAELGADVETVRRAGFLHDIGKALTGEIEGPHALVGARVCQKSGESPDVVHAVEAHHEDVEQRTVEAMIVQACDAISAARPGARRENLDTYIKRLEKLETMANSFEGVERCYAIQAGREIRVLVHPDKIDDLKAIRLARDVAKRIEESLDYPGQIKVTVIRETRTFEFAR